MPARLLEIVIPADALPRARDLLREMPTLDTWEIAIDHDRALLRVTIEREEAEGIMDRITNAFDVHPGFRLLVTPVEAVVPAIVPGARSPESRNRISREELYADIEGATKSTRIFLTLAILSSVVATLGLVRDNPAVVIGAMVVAPLLGPNIALALATALGDGALARRSIVVNAMGSSLAFAIAFGLGCVLPIDVTVRELASRTDVAFSDVGLALASGVAGALAFTTGLSGALIGVMVAVALLPPLVTLAIMLANGAWDGALGAATLLAVNVISVNLAAVLTFYAQGVRPRTWWEADRARRATRRAAIAWTVLLAALVLIIALARLRSG